MLLVAFGSAWLTNDTLAVIGTPIALLIARQTGCRPVVLLLALCFSLTFGSLLTPVGNPQNLLISQQGHMAMPFYAFLKYGSLPVITGLGFSFLWLCFLYRGTLSHPILTLHFKNTERNRCWPVYLSLCLFLVMMLFHALAHLLGIIPLPLSILALLSIIPLFLFLPIRRQLLWHNDYATLIFFIAMFIVIGTVWHSGYLQQMLRATHLPVQSPASIYLISSVMSQLISNVPMVALYLTFLHHSLAHLMALASASTLSGNFFITSAASTIIVIQQAEKRGERALTFFRFALVGLPVTLVSLAVSYLWVVTLSVI